MTRDDIIRMAREAGLADVLEEHAHEYGNGTFMYTAYPELERFAALVTAAKDAEHQQTLALQQRSYEREIEIEVEAEREACAQIADAEASIEGIAQRVAAAIRARRNT